jgi:hypothetical protein
MVNLIRKKMKALSIKQPWAWLIVAGHKDIENRDWRSDNPGLKYRGEVLIHTGLRMDDDWSAFGIPEICRHVPADEDLPRGGIVGIAEIVDCVKEHESPLVFRAIWLCPPERSAFTLLPMRRPARLFRAEL